MTTSSSLKPSIYLSVFSFIFFSILVFPYFTHLVEAINRKESRHDQLLIELPSSEFLSHERAKPGSTTILHVDDYGAIGDGLTDDTQAFVDAWKVACSLSSQSTIVFPFGNTYLVRRVDFYGHCESKVTIKILGAIVAPEDPDAWDRANSRFTWLYFEGLNSLNLDGGGTIDGMGQEWWARSCKVNKSMPCHHAPNAITFHRCNDLKVRDLNMVNGQQMHMVFTDCSNVSVSGVRINTPSASPNTDGIHLSSSVNVVVRDSVISTGDDCISIVSNSSSILIKNVMCGLGHGISVGSLGERHSCVKVHDVTVDGVLLMNTKNGARIKTWQGGRGSATDITFRNILMVNVSNPIIIDQYYCDSPVHCKNQTSAVKVKRISFVNIKGTSATGPAVKFACSDSSPCKQLYLQDIFLVPSFSRERTSSFCWSVYGSTSGLVLPHPCFPSDSTALIKERTPAHSFANLFSA